MHRIRPRAHRNILQAPHRPYQLQIQIIITAITTPTPMCTPTTPILPIVCPQMYTQKPRRRMNRPPSILQPCTRASRAESLPSKRRKLRRKRRSADSVRNSGRSFRYEPPWFLKQVQPKRLRNLLRVWVRISSMQSTSNWYAPYSLVSLRR